MSPRTSVPKIDPRRADDLLRILREMAPHYTREWPARDDSDPGVALLKIFSNIAEGVISRLNLAPDRNFLAFLDMLGIRLLPARAARAPVRFRVANGTENAFLVPRGTQVSAPPTEQRPGDLPFETVTNLLVIPAALTTLIAVDPDKDRIYKSPPGFLELDVAATQLPPLTVTAFSAANSKFLQLGPPEQVKEGDFLRIEQLPQTEHLVVAGAKGSIVTLTEPLTQDQVEGTVVQRVTQFELFEGKNWQEHILYLAHADYLAIKSEAEITLMVQHANTNSNLQPFNLSWEFFGVIDPNEEEGWHAFKVDADGTQGFSHDGQVVLFKPAGEIKETELNGNKSRWIRARLNAPLPRTAPTLLPRIESISLATSLEKGIAADKAFSNDTPLTTDVAFFPFGTEPRIFDRFSIASEEAFSKRGAVIELEVTMDSSDLLAAPAATVVDGFIRAFARAAGGKLLEFKIGIQPSSSLPGKHGTPPGTTISAGSSPAVVQFTDANGKRVGAFVKADDGNIYLRSIFEPPDANNKKDEWFPLLAPPGELQFDPAAVLVGNNQWRVFVVADNELYSKIINPLETNAATAWNPISGTFQVASTPHAIAFGGTFAVGVTDSNGHTWVFDGTTWKDRTPPISADNPTPQDALLAATNARPYLRSYVAASKNEIQIFLRSKNNALVVFDTEDNSKPQDLGPPSATVLVDSNPVVIDRGAGPVVYVRGSDNHLWETSVPENWTEHPNPTDFNLAGDPFAVAVQTVKSKILKLASILTTTDKNALLEFRARGDDVHAGDLRAGPLEIVMLEANPGEGTHFIQITDGPGHNSSESAVRRIDPERSEGKFAVLDTELDEIATDETQYDLFRQEATGEIVKITSNDKTSIELKADANPAAKQFLFAADELREISSANGRTAVFDPPWTAPEVGDKYYLLQRISEERFMSESAANRVVLAKDSATVATKLEGLFLEIPSVSSIGKQIIKYFKNTQNVILSEDFPEPPKNNAPYKVAVSSAPENLLVYVDPDQSDIRPELSWEYSNGRGWAALQLKEESTDKFLISGKVKFTVPEDIAKTEVGGEENYWIRARIIGGDYGREVVTFNQKTGDITSKKDPIRPPKIEALSITYELTELKSPQFCLTFNNLDYLDQTAANITQDKYFNPYVSLSDAGKALYFGFDRAFKSGPVKLYFAADELEVDERNKPKLTWEFAFENNWKTLLTEDATEAFTKPEFVSLNVPDGLQNRQQFGRALYWLRATLTEGAWTENSLEKSPLFDGVFINTVETLQARTMLDEILGSSRGVKNQSYRFQQLPVIAGEEVRVREVLTEIEREDLIREQGKDVVFPITDQAGRILETWIRWTEVPEFFESKPESRHYRLDRHTGEIEFGNGERGRIPPVGGDNIKAFAYQAGGGASGNANPGEINTPVTAVAGVDSVINPVAAGGGSEAATNEEMLEIGPAQISHRGRAVTPDDFEQLAREASREVRKARCLPNRNASGRHELGWTSVHIVPDSKDAKPSPSLELRRAVQRYLAARADVTLEDQGRIFVGPAEFIPVDVEVTVFAKSLDKVASAEQTVKKKLEEFLHPLTGGPDKEGWDFGRDLVASDLYSLLEEIPEVDHVEALQLLVGDSPTGELVAVAPDALVASGNHKIIVDVQLESR